MGVLRNLAALTTLLVAKAIQAESPIEVPPGQLTELLVTAQRIETGAGSPPAPSQDPPLPTCRDPSAGEAWIDRMQAGLYRTVCLSAARTDGFFGNDRNDDAYEATYGSLSVGSLWDQRDHWDPTVRFRANVKLPQLNDRYRAFVGRVDPDEYVSDTRDDFDTLPRQFAGDDDDSVLVGLGYRQPKRRGGYFDTSAGVKLRWPPEPYVKGGYHLALPFLERNLLRFNETLFWRSEEGFGTTTRFDIERLLTDDLLIRLTGSGTFSEDTEGLEWFSNLTLFQTLAAARAFAYQIGISGETDREIPIEDYGLRVIYRQRIYREWLYLELRSSVGWPRDTWSERREANWGAGVALEMQFGQRNGNR